MRYWKFWTIPIAISAVIVLETLALKEQEGEAKTEPQVTLQPLTAAVQEQPLNLVTQRIGLGLPISSSPHAELIQTLKALRPSWIRSQPEAGDNFFTLCTEVQANPWIVIPSALSDADLDALGRDLALHADSSRFSEVMVELHPNANSATFQRLVQAAGPQVALHQVASRGDPDPAAETVAIPSPIPVDLSSKSGDSEELKLLFQAKGSDLRQLAQEIAQQNRKLALYDLNIQTASNLKSSEIAPIASGAASGAAFAKNILAHLSLSATPLISSLLDQKGPSSTLDWGLCLNDRTSYRLRPAGLALYMLNEAIGGSLHAITPSHDDGRLTMVAFRTDHSWSAAVVSGETIPLDLALSFPEDALILPTHLHLLKAASPLDTNEERVLVMVDRDEVDVKGRTVTFTLPAYGFVILTSDDVVMPTLD